MSKESEFIVAAGHADSAATQAIAALKEAVKADKTLETVLKQVSATHFAHHAEAPSAGPDAAASEAAAYASSASADKKALTEATKAVQEKSSKGAAIQNAFNKLSAATSAHAVAASAAEGVPRR